MEAGVGRNDGAWLLERDRMRLVYRRGIFTAILVLLEGEELGT